MKKNYERDTIKSIFKRRLKVLLIVVLILMPITHVGLYYYRYNYCKRIADERARDVVNFCNFNNVLEYPKVFAMKMIQEANDAYASNAGNVFIADIGGNSHSIETCSDSRELGVYFSFKEQTDGPNAKRDFIDNDHYVSQIGRIGCDFYDAYDSADCFYNISSDGLFTYSRNILNDDVSTHSFDFVVTLNDGENMVIYVEEIHKDEYDFPEYAIVNTFDTSNEKMNNDDDHIYLCDPQGANEFIDKAMDIIVSEEDTDYMGINSFAFINRIAYDTPEYSVDYDSDTQFQISMYPEHILCLYCECPDVFASNNLAFLLLTLGYIVVGLMIVFISSAITNSHNQILYAREDYRKTLCDALAHDIRTPLMAMQGYSENLLINVHNEKRDYYANKIVDNITYINSILTNVMDLSKIEPGKVIVECKSCDLSTIFKLLCDYYDKEITDRGITLNISKSLITNSDRALMQTMAENLFTNAIKYTPSGGVIDIRREGDKTLVISNTINTKSSFGIDEELDIDVDNLWNPFVKGDSSRGNENGSGLGLSIVKNILDIHGYEGKIEIKDDRFVVTINGILNAPESI